MQSLSIIGGAPLRGTIPIHGAKNSVLPILAGCLLCRGTCTLHNCPNIQDVTDTSCILGRLGCPVHRCGSSLQIDARSPRGVDVPGDLARRMRSSVLFLGALLARQGCARLPLPGGCPLGARPIDLHLSALRQMGAEITVEDGALLCRAERLHGAEIHLPFPSVGATENILLAATEAQGTVVLHNAAREPEIGDLVAFLTAAGADITGKDTETLTIRGGKALHGCTHTVMSDRIETATYLCAAAGCGGDVTLLRTRAQTLLPVLEVLKRAGCALQWTENTIHLTAPERLYGPGAIITSPYPGFPTDAQAPMMAALLRADGETTFRETIFEDRLHHAVELAKMGADIRVDGRSAKVRGVSALRGAQLQAGDLRGGAAMVIAALQSPEKSTITGVKHLKRGYDDLAGMLQSLGAAIKYVEI